MRKLRFIYIDVVPIGIAFTVMLTSSLWGGSSSDTPAWLIPRFGKFVSCCLIPDYFEPVCVADEFRSAVYTGNVACVDDLLGSGENIDSQLCLNGMTPLMVAISKRKFVMAVYLINKGASISLMDNKQRTALHYAAMYGDEQLARFLLQQGADMSVTDYKGYNSLRLAVMHEQLPVVRALMNADVDESTAQTALTVALAGKHSCIVKEFLRRGVCLESSRVISDCEYDLQDVYHKKRFKLIQALLYDHDLPDVLVNLICLLSNVRRYSS